MDNNSRSDLTRGFTAIGVILAVGAIVAVILYFAGVFDSKEEGDTCTPGEDDEVTNAKTYEIDSDGDCTIVKTCEDGYKPNASKDACEEDSGDDDDDGDNTVVLPGDKSNLVDIYGLTGLKNVLLFVAKQVHNADDDPKWLPDESYCLFATGNIGVDTVKGALVSSHRLPGQFDFYLVSDDADRAFQAVNRSTPRNVQFIPEKIADDSDIFMLRTDDKSRKIDSNDIYTDPYEQTRLSKGYIVYSEDDKLLISTSPGNNVALFTLGEDSEEFSNVQELKMVNCAAGKYYDKAGKTCKDITVECTEADEQDATKYPNTTGWVINRNGDTCIPSECDDGFTLNPDGTKCEIYEFAGCFKGHPISTNSGGTARLYSQDELEMHVGDEKLKYVSLINKEHASSVDTSITSNLSDKNYTYYNDDLKGGSDTILPDAHCPKDLTKYLNPDLQLVKDYLKENGLSSFNGLYPDSDLRRGKKGDSMWNYTNIRDSSTETDKKVMVLDTIPGELQSGGGHNYAVYKIN